MRLGTRSCAECRRRKVRCIFEPNAQVCRQCAAHGVTCAAQERSRGHNDHFKPVPDAQERLAKLEGMVRYISGVMGFNIEASSLADFETSTTEAFKRLQQPPTPESNVDSRFTERSYSPSLPQSDPLTTASGTTHSLEQAPLLDLFKAAMLLERDSAQSDKDQLETLADQGIRSCIISLNSLLPRDNDLTLILKTTEKYWPLWKPFPESVFATSKFNENDRVGLAKNFILESIKSGYPTYVARAVLCLAFSLQQLPTNCQCHKSLPSPANVLIDSYLTGAETLLMFESTTPTLDGVECWPLLAKIYTNMGKPRKAWLSCRRAMDLALLLGLDRISDTTDDQGNILWAGIWQFERNTSLLTGVPYGISESRLSLSNGDGNKPVAKRVMHKLAIIAGHIIDRNQDLPNTGYSNTVKIDEELRQCRNEMPSEWWDPEFTPLSLEAIYSTQSIKMHYLTLVKLLHLPHMLMSSVDANHEHHKGAGINAAREMIESYRKFRHDCGSTFLMCDILDFFVFTAAVLIIINLLSSSIPVRSDQEARDWVLVKDVIEILHQVAREMECSVADQAAQLLDYLSMCYRGNYSGPEVYEAIIPYFGKMRIRQQVKKSTPIDSAPSNLPQDHLILPSLNTVEFSADFTPPVSHFPVGDYFSDAEMGIDWTSNLDMDSPAYNWNYVFDNIGTS
jgi:hypothetical protein